MLILIFLYHPKFSKACLLLIFNILLRTIVTQTLVHILLSLCKKKMQIQP